MVSRLRYWIRVIVRRSALEREMRDEMQLHLERQTDLLVTRGMARADARLSARREFGNVGVHQEDARDARGVRWVESISADVRFAFRFFARKPLSAATIVLVLAFGIAGYAAVFGLLQSATMRPPPGVPDDVPLVVLRGRVRQKEQPAWSPMLFSYPELRETSALRTIFSAVTAWTESDVVVDVPGVLDRAVTRVQFVTDGYFDIVGVRPPQGSALPATVQGASAESQLVGVISDAMWEDAFGRKDVRNRTIMVNGVGVRIVGVAPSQFNGALAAPGKRRLLMWLPLATRPTVLAASRGTSSSAAAALSSVDSTIFEAVGRLHPGVSPEQATAAVRVVAGHAVSQMTPPRAVGPEAAKPPALVYDADVLPLRGWAAAGSGALGLQGDDNLVPIFTALGVVATLVLLVVCTNVAALVISAAVGRRQEIAVRLSLGASRARVIRQLLTESTVLATFGAALALVVYWGVIVVLSRIPQAAFFRPDLGTIGFTMVIALGTGMLCGLAPALHATRGGVASALKDTTMGATRRSRLQHAFVVAQVMLTQPLLLLIALIVGQSLMQTKKQLPAGVPERVLRLDIDTRFVPGSFAEQRAAVERVLQKIAEVPGVVTVLPAPVFIRFATLGVRDEDRGAIARAADPVASRIMVLTPGYFDLIGVPLVRGSDLAPTSDTSATMIIGSDLARRLWGNADPIGRRFSQISPVQTVKREIVVSGVYDSRYVDTDHFATVYRAVNKNNLWSGSYLIRTAVPAADLAASIHRIARAELPSTPIEPLVTLAQMTTASMRTERKIQEGAAAVGVLVLLLSSIGLYGAVALGVGQRRREIGVRMALGARAGQVIALFYAGGVRLGIIGLALGLPISLAASAFMNSHEAGVTNADTTPSLVLVGGLIAVVVLVVASAATLIPATRAAGVNPVTALRSE
jgi:predicted permease